VRTLESVCHDLTASQGENSIIILILTPINTNPVETPNVHELRYNGRLSTG